MSDGEVVSSDMAILEDLLQKGFIPVLHGDCVRDKARGFGILSGDSIVEVSCLFARNWYLVALQDKQPMEYCCSVAIEVAPVRVQLVEYYITLTSFQLRPLLNICKLHI